MKARPLVLTGMGRSGTTMLHRLCNAHPQMEVTDEFGNYSFIGDSFPRYVAHTAARIQWIRGRWPILGPPRYVSSRFPRDIRLRSMNYAVNLRVAATHLSRVARRRPDRVTLADLLETACGDDQKLRIVGDKLPNYVFMLDRLVTLPRLLRLVIYRDCRDLTSSYLARIRTDWKHQRWARYVDTAEKVARRWVHAIEHMESHAEDLYLVRYEDIVANPLAELRPIAEWLGVDLSGFDTKIVLSASVGKHKRGLTARELDDVLRVAGPTMERLNYRIA